MLALTILQSEAKMKASPKKELHLSFLLLKKMVHIH